MPLPHKVRKMEGKPASRQPAPSCTFNMKYGNGNNKRTTVNIDGKTVWQDGKKVRHAIDTTNDKYTDGYKDNAFEILKMTPRAFM